MPSCQHHRYLARIRDASGNQMLIPVSQTVPYVPPPPPPPSIPFDIKPCDILLKLLRLLRGTITFVRMLNLVISFV